MSDTIELGPLPGSEPPFKARMRAHQAWYRAAVLSAPCGTGPTATSTTLLGSMLDATAGAQGKNFLTPEIHDVVEARIREGGGIEPFRCRHNLLSSQPMCANLFGPLVGDNDLATRLLRSMLGDEVARVVDVVIEWVQEPADDYLSDRTALDAFIGYQRPDDTAAFLGIETKLTEPFSAIGYDATPRYRQITENPGSPWKPDRYEQVADKRWNQLWRNHMLVEAIRLHPDEGYGAGRLAVVHHPGDPDIATSIDGYRQCLKAPGDLLVWPLDGLCRAWQAATPLTEPQQAWLDAFALRYLDLDRSKPARQQAGVP